KSKPVEIRRGITGIGNIATANDNSPGLVFSLGAVWIAGSKRWIINQGRASADDNGIAVFTVNVDIVTRNFPSDPLAGAIGSRSKASDSLRKFPRKIGRAHV